MSSPLDRLCEFVGLESLSRDMFASGTGRLLESRDAEPFDSTWVHVFEKVEALSEVRNLSEGDQSKIESIRETTYMWAFRLTGDPDAAACVSDDFGLIATAAAAEFDDPWISALWLSYRSGVFPGGSLEPANESLGSLL